MANCIKLLNLGLYVMVLGTGWLGFDGPAKAELSESEWRTYYAYSKWLFNGGWEKEYQAFFDNYMSKTVYKSKAECIGDVSRDARNRSEPFAIAGGALVGILASPKAGVAVYNASREGNGNFMSRAYCNLVNSPYGIPRCVVPPGCSADKGA